MMIVGLTGGIGSGKSTVGRMFAALGVPVYDSDLEARRIMESSEAVRDAVIGLLGEEAYTGSRPDRAYIAGRVFGDEPLLSQLNAIIHPAVRSHFKAWAKQQHAPYVIQEAAILFENGSYKKFDRIILVTAPSEVRIGRIMERDESSREAIEARMGHQWPDEKKAELADFVLENLDLETTRSGVREIHRQLRNLSR